MALVLNKSILGVKWEHLVAKNRWFAHLMAATALWTLVVGLSALWQRLASDFFIADLFWPEQINTFTYGFSVILLSCVLQTLDKFPKIMETRWLIFHVILSAFSYLIYESIFIETVMFDTGSFVSKKSSFGMSIVDHVFGNGFGLYVLTHIILVLTRSKDHLNTIEDKSKQLTSPFLSRVRIKLANKIYFLPVDDIHFATSANNYCDLHTLDNKHVIRESISRLEKQLDPSVFMRIHRSSIVKVEKVSEILTSKKGVSQLKMKNGQLLNVGAKYKRAVLDKFSS